MTTGLSKSHLVEDFKRLGIKPGDVLLVRSSVRAVGSVTEGVEGIIKALLDVVGTEGTLVSLAFTDSSFFRKPKIEDAFHSKKRSYAGILPNAMIERRESFRSRHPTCSYVAIGKFAEYITADHDETSPAYAPIQKIIDLRGKNVLIGCVSTSPGFTSAHLAEFNLGYLDRLPIFPWLNQTYYYDKTGKLRIFKRKDPGLCSESFYKFYAHYVRRGILNVGYVGAAYSIVAPAKECYDIELEQLREDPRFNICGSRDCWTCNAGRWDRIHYLPPFVLKKVINYLLKN